MKTKQRILAAAGAALAAPALVLATLACADARALADSPDAALSASPDTLRPETLLALLRASDPTVCEMAVHMLGNTWGTSRVARFHDRASRLGGDFSGRAVRVEGEAEVRAVAAALGDENACARRAAARLLAQSPAPAAREALREGLGSGSPTVREAAAYGAGMVEDPRSRDALLRLLGDGPDRRQSAGDRHYQRRRQERSRRTRLCDTHVR